MSTSQIAVILYTLRQFTQTPADIVRTLRRVKAIGYDVVQLSGLGPIDARELRRILDGEGLQACSSHVSYAMLRNNMAKVIEDHHIWGCKHVVLAGLPPEMRNLQGYRTFAREGSEFGRTLAKEGLTFSYHNHSFELEKYDGRTGLSIIFEESDPNFLFAEIDTYWIQHGGGDAAAWIGKLKGRQHLVHLKDMAVIEGKPAMAEIGEGNMNWPAILEACRQAGVQWYVVEQDVCLRDPFESIGISLRYLKGMGLS